MVKNNEAGNFFNAVEREPVPMRVFNPKASGGLGCGAPGVGCKGCSRPQKKIYIFYVYKFWSKISKKFNFFLQIYMKDSESAEFKKNQI